MKIGFSEKLVAYIWHHQMVSEMVTDNGDKIYIIYPGRVSSDGGCDFQDSVFTINGKMIRGDIEIHVLSSQWYVHGHHNNPRYNNIVLHVVMWYDHQSFTILHNGKTIPTVCLSSFLPFSLSEISQRIKSSHYPVPSCTEITRYPRKKPLLELLNTAGEKRFIIKATSFHKELAEEEAGQVLFRNIAGALGYSRNTEQFKALTNRLPLRTLEEIGLEAEAVSQAWILGTAGLLPSQRFRMRHQPDGKVEVERLEKIWQSTGRINTIAEHDWCFFRIRPANFPTRRIIALSHLLIRYRQPGLLYGLLELIREASGKAKHLSIENGVTIPGKGYWANHFDFGTATTKSSMLLGREQAREIVINILLPFAYAWGNLYSEPELRKKAIQVYARYPRSGKNQLIHHMRKQFLLESDMNLSACQQQGLIHIFKTFCRHRDCSNCIVTFNRN